MKIKNIVFEQKMFEALNNLLEAKISLEKSFKISELAKELEQKGEIYNGLKNKLLNEFGTKSEEKSDDGKTKFTFSEKKSKEFNKKFQELLDIEFNINGDKIKLKKEIEIQAKYAFVLQNIITLI